MSQKSNFYSYNIICTCENANMIEDRSFWKDDIKQQIKQRLDFQPAEHGVTLDYY